MECAPSKSPNMTSIAARVANAHRIARTQLLEARISNGTWEGKLSSSALSTATASCALTIANADAPSQELAAKGRQWLAENQNPDGGWGDTTLSVSNISTTTLCWAALNLGANNSPTLALASQRAGQWLLQKAGTLAAPDLAAAITARYGNDRTFSIPILTMCALSGRLGAGPAAWDNIPQLPFELAALPHQAYSLVRLPVVSYALPALIAIGQVHHHHRPSRNPLLRHVRDLLRKPTLNLLERIQPSSGGFLEATPLTSFVAMSLAASGQGQHPVTRKALAFITRSVRPDGSWPIDTNLATWLTTLAINALSTSKEIIPSDERVAIIRWLVDQQGKSIHPYTHATPGGWAWTPLPGGVPDADDTAGAVLALHTLASDDPEVGQAASAGIQWLLNVQNRDGGIPTFCRGWGHLAFDKSSPDLTAHALRAWVAWRSSIDGKLRARVDKAMHAAARFLVRTQSTDGSWTPLWFGNQDAPHDENHTYGTSRVCLALAELIRSNLSSRDVADAFQRGVSWLAQAELPSGGWSGFPGGKSSIEETALALEALAAAYGVSPAPELYATLERGALWLTDRVEEGSWKTASPIGFYFAKLWYYESLYPIIFATAALDRLSKVVCVK